MSFDSPTKSILLISTRPLKKENNIKDIFQNSKVRYVTHPLTEISPLADYNKFDSILKNIKRFDHIIFISTNAVNFFTERFNINKLDLPEKIKLSCIGPTTKNILQSKFSRKIQCPEDTFDSENLLKLKIFDNIENKNILIIRGEGGRETLRQGLELKKANVIYGECYLRKYLSIDLKKLKAYEDIFDQIYLLISSLESAKKFMSLEIKKNFYWLNSINFIVNHQNIKDELQPFSKVNLTKDISQISLKKLISKY